MRFRTEVSLPKSPFLLDAAERMLFVGSCFAANIGQKLVDGRFPAVVNPYGTMYNPVSILHTVARWVRERQGDCSEPHGWPRTVVFTLGTNHVYRLRETGEIVDNCEKRPQRLFSEEDLSVDQCADALRRAVGCLREVVPDVRVILTVSPIRYQKYGFHESQLAKATLLLAADRLVKETPERVSYFPAYELLNDELRDYRFYAPDMIHPSEQAVEFIWQKFQSVYFSEQARQMLAEWQPIAAALAHKPFHPDNPEYQSFLAKALEKKRAFEEKWNVK